MNWAFSLLELKCTGTEYVHWNFFKYLQTWLLVTTCTIGICDYILSRLKYREGTDYTLLLSCSIEEWEHKYGEIYCAKYKLLCACCRLWWGYWMLQLPWICRDDKLKVKTLEHFTWFGPRISNTIPKLMTRVVWGFQFRWLELQTNNLGARASQDTWHIEYR